MLQLKQTVRLTILRCMFLGILFAAAAHADVYLQTQRQRATYDQILAYVRTATGYPFSLFPALGGADKTKFINDTLLNRDELMHTQIFLRGQIVIRELTDPDSAIEIKAVERAVRFLLTHFTRLALHADAQGNQAISLNDMEFLFGRNLNDRKSRRI